MRRHISYPKELDSRSSVDAPNQLASSYTTTLIFHASAKLNRGPVQVRKRPVIKSGVGIIPSPLANPPPELGVW